METDLMCFECSGALSTDLNESGFYDTTCANGHRNRVILRTELFELLFEAGLRALASRHHAGSVVLFEAARERAYEFFIRTFVAAKTEQGREAVESGAWDKTWKELRFSQQQLGAFVALHFIVFGESPPRWRREWIEFRNNVVHNGKLPERNKAIEFGKATFEHIHAVIAALRKNHSEAIDAAVNARMAGTAAKHSGKCRLASVETAFGVGSFSDDAPATFEEARKPYEDFVAEVDALIEWERQLREDEDPDDEESAASKRWRMRTEVLTEPMDLTTWPPRRS